MSGHWSVPTGRKHFSRFRARPTNLVFANNADASLDPSNRSTGSGDTEPDTELVHTWRGRRVASSSVHTNAAVNRDFDPRGGVNKSRGAGMNVPGGAHR